MNLNNYVQLMCSNCLLMFISFHLLTDVPTIVLHPVGTTVHVGTDEVEMSCSAIGHSRISYHWERYNFNNSQWSSLTKDGQTDVDDVSTYTLTNIVTNDEGIYRCAATNIDGSGYSNNATITVYGMYVTIRNCYIYICSYADTD